MLLQQMVNILKGAEEIVATLTDVELPEWKCRQQMACIGSPVDTRLDYLEKWWEPVSRTLTFNVFTCLFCPNLCFFLRSGSRLWQKCCSKYANSCRSCRTRSTTAPAPPTLLLPWQKSRISRCPCTQNFCQSETWHHVIQTHRLTHIHTLSYCWHVLLCCCPAALWWLRNNPSCRVHHNDLWFWRPGWDSQRQWGEAHEKLVRTQLVL